MPKDRFPPLLKQLCDSLKEENVIAGFKKCGIVPLNRNKVLDMLPSVETASNDEPGTSTGSQKSAEALDSSLLELLKSYRLGDGSKQRKKRTKVSVTLGKSVGEEDFQKPESEDLATPSTSGTNTCGRPRKEKTAPPVEESFRG